MSGHEIDLDVGEIMQNEQDICPICGSKIVETMIDYSDWSGDRLLVVREVPVRECETNGHRFFQANVARSTALIPVNWLLSVYQRRQKQDSAQALAHPRCLSLNSESRP